MPSSFHDSKLFRASDCCSFDCYRQYFTEVRQWVRRKEQGNGDVLYLFL